MTKRNKLEGGFHRFRADVVLRARARTRLLDGLAGQHTERDRDGQRPRELGQGSRDRVGENVEVGGLTPYQAAERNDRVETPGSREHRYRRRQLEGAGHLELLDLRACGERGLDGTLGERARDLLVPARANDRDARAAIGILHPGRSLPSARHLPQSSPPMHCRLVTT
jgi:hypothetical protein